MVAVTELAGGQRSILVTASPTKIAMIMSRLRLDLLVMLSGVMDILAVQYGRVPSTKIFIGDLCRQNFSKRHRYHLLKVEIENCFSRSMATFN